MENPPDPGDPKPHPIEALVESFVECTASSREEALLFLQDYNFDLGDAVFAYFFNLSALPELDTNLSTIQDQESHTDPSSPPRSPLHFPCPASPAAHSPHQLGLPQGSENKVKNKDSGSGYGDVITVTDLSKNVSVDRSTRDASNQGQDNYIGGEQSGVLVQDPRTRDNVDSTFDNATLAGDDEKWVSRIFKGKCRSPSAEQPKTVSHTLTFWRNGFTVNDGPLRRMDDPANAPFLESLKKLKLPEELDLADRDVNVILDIEWENKNEDYSEPERHPPALPGTRRTLDSNDVGSPTSPGSSNPPTPYTGLVVDSSLPTTSIQIRLIDGTHIESRFNYSHTIRDIRAFIDASGSGGARDYQLQAMGLPPKLLTDVDQTIEQAGVANSVVLQRP